jgi:hypothetical protein
MRDYSIVSPKFWIGDTGKALRGNAGAQVLALYLMTSPHANMIGVFHCPVLYMAHETGLGMEGASKALQSLIEADFCTYEEGSETVFVHRMASYQVGESLKEGDNRIKAVIKEWSGVANPQLRQAFADRYTTAYHLPTGQEKEAPSKPLRSQEQEQEQEQDKKPTASSADKLPPCHPQSVIDLYHEALPELPAVRLMTDKRRKAIGGFWRWVLTSKKPDDTRRAQTSDQALTWIRAYFDRARENDFLMGRTQRGGEHANWQCDLDFLMTDRGMKHVIEKTKEPA